MWLDVDTKTVPSGSLELATVRPKGRASICTVGTLHARALPAGSQRSHKLYVRPSVNSNIPDGAVPLEPPRSADDTEDTSQIHIFCHESEVAAAAAAGNAEEDMLCGQVFHVSGLYRPARGVAAEHGLYLYMLLDGYGSFRGASHKNLAADIEQRLQTAYFADTWRSLSNTPEHHTIVSDATGATWHHPQATYEIMCSVFPELHLQALAVLKRFMVAAANACIITGMPVDLPTAAHVVAAGGSGNGTYAASAALAGAAAAAPNATVPSNNMALQQQQQQQQQQWLLAQQQEQWRNQQQLQEIMGVEEAALADLLRSRELTMAISYAPPAHLQQQLPLQQGPVADSAAITQLLGRLSGHKSARCRGALQNRLGVQPPRIDGWVNFLYSDDLAPPPGILPGLLGPSEDDVLLPLAPELLQLAAAPADMALVAAGNAAAGAGALFSLGGSDGLDDEPLAALLLPPAAEPNARRLQGQMSDATADSLARIWELSMGMLAADGGYKRVMRKHARRAASLRTNKMKVLAAYEAKLRMKDLLQHNTTADVALAVQQ